MATQNLRIEGDIAQDKGSDLMFLIEHDSSYVLTGDKYVLPFYEDSGTSKSVSSISKTTEGGIVASEDGDTTITKTVNIIQGNAAALNITETLADKTFAWVKQKADSQTAGGKYVYEVGLGAKISQAQSFSGKSSTSTITFNVTAPSASQNVALASFDDVLALGDLATLGTVAIPAGRGYKYFEADPA